MLTNTNMGGPSVNQFFQALPLNEETTKATEIKLNQPKPFSGKREDLKKFLQDTNLYLVFKSPVRSGFLPFFDATATATGFLLW